MLTSALPSPLTPATVFAELTSIAVDRSQALDVAELKVRNRLRSAELQNSETVASLLGSIEGMVEDERRGELGFTDEELTAEIEWMSAAEADLKRFLGPAQEAFRQLAEAAAREGAGRRDLLRVAGKEYARIAGHLAAGLQEARWMLIGILDGREPRAGGVTVSTPEELRRLLTTS